MNNIYFPLIRTGNKCTSIIAVKSICLIIAFVMPLLSMKLDAQTLRHPLSEVTTTEKHYTYNYIISPAQMKVLRYIIVRSGNGEVMTSFDACDVCYKANKGYSQVDNELKCNNCGNRFKIADLGSQGTGGCWPGFLQHTIEGDEVVINISDLIKGEYYFPPQAVSAVKDDSDSEGLSISYSDSRLFVDFGNPGNRNIKIYSIDGKLLRSVAGENSIFQAELGGLVPGVYFLTVDGSGYSTAKQFLISK